MRHGVSLVAQFFDGRRDGAERAPPTDHENFATLGSVHFERWKAPGDPGNLLRALFHHGGVAFRVVYDVPRHRCLGEPPDAVFEACRSWDGPGPCEGLRISGVRFKVSRSVAGFGIAQPVLGQ